MSTERGRIWIGILIAVGAVTVTGAVRALLSLAGLATFPFLIFVPAVLVASVYGGVGAAYLALGLSTVAAATLRGNSGVVIVGGSSLAVTIVFFIAINLVIIWICQQLRDHERRVSEGTIAAAQLGAIVTNSDDAIIAKSLDGIIESWNKGAERIFGYTSQEAIGQPMVMLFPKDRVSEEESILGRLRNGERIDHYETIRVRKDGQLRNVSVTVSPIRNREGVIVGASKIARDITLEKLRAQEREKLLEREKVARQEAERAGRVKDEFLATLSHELRTPLNAVLGYAQVLRNVTTDPQEISEGLEIIERNARIQAQIVADLLDMSRIVSGNLRLDVTPTALVDVICAGIETTQPAATAKQISVERVFDSDLPLVMIDPSRFQQVIWNLLSNAIKFTPAQGRVRIDLHRHDGRLDLTVSDTGPGIPPEFLPYVFDRFSQADPSTTRRHGGLGLGLSIVKQLVELHGGTVSVGTADNGHGARFVVSLPLGVDV